MTLRLAWFASARGTSSRLLLEHAQRAIASGRLDAEIVVVFCNRTRGQSANTDAFLDLVEASGTPLVTIASGEWRKRVDGELSDPQSELAPWRADYDRAVREAIAPYRPDVGLLAGYMLITTAELCDYLPLLNLHPAAPGGPVGTWKEVIRNLIEQRASTSGIMLQRATTQLDEGPIVTACRYPLHTGTLASLWDERASVDEAGELFQTIRAEGVKREPHFIVASLAAIASARIVIPERHAAGPALDLTTEVELAIEDS